MPRYPNIEAERARLGMTKSEFSNAIGVYRHTYYDWQCGKTEMKVPDILRISKITGKSFDYLMQEVGDNAES